MINRIKIGLSSGLAFIISLFSKLSLSRAYASEGYYAQPLTGFAPPPSTKDLVIIGLLYVVLPFLLGVTIIVIIVKFFIKRKKRSQRGGKK